MKYSILAAATAAAFALAPMSASAVTATAIAYSTNGAGNTADVFAGDFNATLPTGATWAGTDPTVTPPPTSLSGAYKSPFENVTADPTVENNTYFSVGGSSGGEGAPSPQTLNYSASAFSLLWGSIDTYNTITFFSEIDGGGSEVGSWTGSTIISQIETDLTGGTSIPLVTSTGYDIVALIEFTGDFKSISFSSENSDGGDIAAMEFAMPIPGPFGALLIGTAFLGAGALRRFGRKAA